MNIKHGLSQLEACLKKNAPERLPDFYALEARCKKNEDDELILGSSENTRNESHQIIRSLNSLSLKHCETSFNQLCLVPKQESKVPEKLDKKQLKPFLLKILIVIIVLVVVWIGLITEVPHIFNGTSPFKASPSIQTEIVTTPTFVLPPTEVPFKILYITFDPTPPAASDDVKVFACTQGRGGVGITLRVSVNTATDGSNNGEWQELKELGVPCFNQVDAPIWFTTDWQPGTYQIKAEAKSSDDPHWEHPVVMTTTYVVK